MNNSSDQDNQKSTRGSTEIRWYIVLYIALGILSTIILLNKIISSYCCKKKYYNPNYCYQDCYYDQDCYCDQYYDCDQYYC